MTVVFFGTLPGGKKPVAYPAKTGEEDIAGKGARLEMMKQAFPIPPDILFQQEPAMSEFFLLELQVLRILNSFHDCRFPICFS